MKNFFFALFILAISLPSTVGAQTNIISTNQLSEEVMKGNYNPSNFIATQILNHPDTIIRGIHKFISADSLKNYIIQLASFENRNTGADTVSLTTGMGASRRWVYQKFQEFSASSDNRLIPSYLQFDQAICNMSQHRNIFCVLPGMDTTDKSVILIEGHMDSRCSVLCDINCNAEGVEDNASGTALVMELARVMSKYSYKHTLVFLVTIGEEQGLFGAKAFADYTQNNQIKVKSVLNNDVIGGIICGKTSSAPSCPSFNHIDSTQIRLFSSGGFNSPHKALARFIKLQYKEELLPLVSVPMQISIMSAEDRTGRGGDHIPFRQKGIPSMRFTSANEHGNASNTTTYDDRQHTEDDILGVDTNGDMVIDSFFVDFNYLARNATINGVAAGLMAIGPEQPDFNLGVGDNTLDIEITQATQYNNYRIGVRTITNDWDSVYTTQSLISTIPVTENTYYYVSVASVDEHGIESLFSKEERKLVYLGLKENNKTLKAVELLQNKPNPFDESTIISILVNDPVKVKNAFIQIKDLNGREVEKIPLQLAEGMNEVLYEHGYNVTGTYIYSLLINGKVIESRKMQFIN
ncbi:MAG: M28 family peptidase [Bacteroidota bacterium]|nr:M28 family peptidase [Bacteroidota bacterium]